MTPPAPLALATALALLAAAGSDLVGRLAEIRDRLLAEDTDAAIVLAEEAVAAAPGSAEAWVLLGRSYGQKADLGMLAVRYPYARKCKAALERAVALSPDDVEGLTLLAEFEATAPGLVGGDRDAARGRAARLLRIDPVAGRMVGAWIAFREGSRQATEAELRAAAAADPPGTGRGAAALASYRAAAGKRDAAKAALRRALEAMPPYGARIRRPPSRNPEDPP